MIHGTVLLNLRDVLTLENEALNLLDIDMDEVNERPLVSSEEAIWCEDDADIQALP
jgi:hypothetical protein